MCAERTLIVSGSEKGLDGMTSFLKNCGYPSVVTISSGSEARRMIHHDSYGLIIINTPLKDETGYQLSLKLSEDTCAAVILICKADIADEMTNRTIDYGVCVVPKPLNKVVFLQAIRTGTAFHHRMLALHQENAKLRTKLEELRYVSRAKCLLIVNSSCPRKRRIATLKKTPWTPDAPERMSPWRSLQNTNTKSLFRIFFRTSFRQISPLAASKILARHKVCLRIFSLSPTKSCAKIRT